MINPFTQLDYSKIRDINTTLFDVEINGSELCNRTCSFCPRHDPEVYPNQNLHMSIETCSNLVDGLKGIESIGVVSFVGFGEPLLFKNLIECVKIVREGDQVELEGSGLERTVLVEFDSKEKALEAYHSEEYKVALEHALVSSNRFVVIVEGV